MIKTGIYGGSFDPLHNGHISLARQALQKIGLDEVWLIVSPHNPLKKQENLTDDHLRLEMARLALEDEPQLVVSDYEFHLPRPSYMWNTLEQIQQDEPQRELYLLIGEDNWENFDQWYRHEDILKKYHIVVYPRETNSHKPHRRHRHLRYMRAKLMPVSSTMIREKVRNGESIEGLVPAKIADFIEQYHLYRP